MSWTELVAAVEAAHRNLGHDAPTLDLIQQAQQEVKAMPPTDEFCAACGGLAAAKLQHEAQRIHELETACAAMREALEVATTPLPEDRERVKAALAPEAGKALQNEITELRNLVIQLRERAEKAERERDEAAQETAEMVCFLETQLGWEWWWSEGFVGQEHKSQAMQNAQAIRKFLDEKGHAKRFCERLKEREAELARLAESVHANSQALGEKGAYQLGREHAFGKTVEVVEAFCVGAARWQAIDAIRALAKEET